MSDDLEDSEQAELGEPLSNRRESDSFTIELQKTLQETHEEVAARVEPGEARTWEVARITVEQFKPVPFVIWRLSNFVFGSSGNVNKISEGMVYGLKKLLLAAASDREMGEGGEVRTTREALDILPSDVIAGMSVIYAICRRLNTREFERIWRPILDDALLRARIGWELGSVSPKFGPGKSMLAGFAGRSGLAVQISGGKLEQARRALELLATGADIREVGLRIYACEPLQVSAMLLSAAGCGRDAAFGTVSFATKEAVEIENDEQRKWLAAFTLCELAREGKVDLAEGALWETLGVATEADQEHFASRTQKISRRGHGWDWLAR